MDPQPTIVPNFSVVIVGGGPVGLTTSILLSLRSITHLLFERHATTSIHPKSCGINQRTSEIFRKCGIEDQVYAQSAPPETVSRTGWYTSLGPNGKHIVSRDAWGGGEQAEEYSSYSPCRWAMCPQIRLEPILKNRVETLNPGGVLFDSEVTRITQNGSSATVTVQQGESQIEVSARYVIVADGGRSLTDVLGVQWLGQRDISEMVTAHFDAAIRQRHPDPRVFITWFTNPLFGGSIKTGILYPVGPWPSCTETGEEWVFACAKGTLEPKEFETEGMVERIRRTLGLVDLPVKMKSISHWTVNATNAERYRVGRVFLAGDAAHKVPPWGALGMNTGIQDAANLVWKLDMALNAEDERKYDRLLDSYDTERRPIGKSVGEWGLSNLLNHSDVMDVALGMNPKNTAEQNQEAIAPYWDASRVEWAAKQMEVRRALEILDREFKAPGIEVGWFYPSADLYNEGGHSHDGQISSDGERVFRFSVSSTIPGHHIPHNWVRGENGPISVLDFIPLHKLLLLTNCNERAKFNDDRVIHKVVRTGSWEVFSGKWKGSEDVSAILVRPDGIVAWRGERKGLSTETWKRLVDRVLLVAKGS